MGRQRELWGPNKLCAICVLVNVVSCTQHMFNNSDRKCELDKVLCRTIVKSGCGDTDIPEPVVYDIVCFFIRLYEILDFICRQMLAIALVRWIRYYESQCLLSLS